VRNALFSVAESFQTAMETFLGEWAKASPTGAKAIAAARARELLESLELDSEIQRKGGDRYEREPSESN